MSTPPSAETIAAIEAGTVTITRRVEFYESDGTTRWYPQPNDGSRLVGGSVSVDYDRDERRSLDLTLLNDDNLLRPNANGGLWYDKVIKVFRGVTYRKADVSPKIALVEVQGSGNAAFNFRALLAGLGFINAEVLTSAAAVTDISGYDIVLSMAGTSAPTKAALLQQAYNLGKKVVTIGTAATGSHVPAITATSAAGSAITWGITPPTADNPIAGSYTTEAATPTATGAVPTAIAASAVRVAQYTSGGFTNYVAALLDKNSAGGRWMDIHLPNINGAQAQKLFVAGMAWLRNYQQDSSWEVQMGEFVIDNISEANFPYQIKVTGRDYTKRCMNSKLTQATEFSPDVEVIDLIKALAANAGITKFRLPVSNQTIGKTISLDRGTSRWDVMKQAAAAANLEMFFDNEGYLVLREILDPALAPATLVLQTGKNGNLVSYERSANDSQLYNHVCVYGDPADGQEARLPYFAEIKNEDPASPTRISRVGDRYYSEASQFYTSDQQCLDRATSLMKVMALESYDMNMASIYYPWLEAGLIVQVIDPKALASDPTRFLLASIDFPIALGPMTVVARRVTYISTT